MLGGWRNGESKTMGLGLPFAILSTLVATWFVATSGNLLITTPAVKAADQTVALLTDGDEQTDAADSGITDPHWSEPVALSSERKPDPAANPFLDATPIRVAHRSGAHHHHRNQHRKSVLHHHH